MSSADLAISLYVMIGSNPPLQLYCNTHRIIWCHHLDTGFRFTRPGNWDFPSAVALPSAIMVREVESQYSSFLTLACHNLKYHFTVLLSCILKIFDVALDTSMHDLQCFCAWILIFSGPAETRPAVLHCGNYCRRPETREAYHQRIHDQYIVAGFPMRGVIRPLSSSQVFTSHPLVAFSISFLIHDGVDYESSAFCCIFCIARPSEDCHVRLGYRLGQSMS